MADYVKKIKNLLALAESPNEHEARSALLMARKLMAKYKVLEKDLENPETQDVEQKLTGITYSIRRDPWVKDLANVIAKHHCCRPFQNRGKGKQTAEIGFVGLTDDIAICMEVFRYAVDCVRSITDKYRKQKSAKAANGYGYGFVLGLIEAYDKQQKEECFDLVLAVPEKVNKAMEGMAKAKQSEKKLHESDVRTFRKGMQDGREFDMEKRLQRA